MARGWNAFRDCPHNVFCLSKKECERADKKGATLRDGNGANTVANRHVRASYSDRDFEDE